MSFNSSSSSFNGIVFTDDLSKLEKTYVHSNNQKVNYLTSVLDRTFHQENSNENNSQEITTTFSDKRSDECSYEF